MDDRVRVGMTVVDADGRRMGKITRRNARSFEVQRGFWGPRQWVVRDDEVLEASGDRIVVARSDEALFQLAAGGLPAFLRRGSGTGRTGSR